MIISACPKCGYRRLPQDSQVLAGICPACGIAYQKWLDRLRPKVSALTEPVAAVQTHAFKTIGIKIRARLFETPDQTDSLALSGRAGLYLLFFIWGWLFIIDGINWEGIGGSFLHNINLPFHEFGHVLFTPFGRFMSILGGSLFQVVMPLVLMVAFIVQRKDPFAASIMLWWSGQNFIDVAPYIADAPYRAIPLIRGLGEDHHDWGNLLSMMGMVDSARAFALASFAMGVFLMLVSYAWGGYLLFLQKQRV